MNDNQLLLMIKNLEKKPLFKLSTESAQKKYENLRQKHLERLKRIKNMNNPEREEYYKLCEEFK